MFSPFRLDLHEQQLWRGDVLVHLKPMAFAVLHHLLDHAGKLITREQLLARFWGDVHIGEGVLKTHVAEVRQALGDCARAPRFIETVRGRGYRFIGHPELVDRAGGPVSEAPPSPQVRTTRPPPCASPVVGRQPEVDFLGACWMRAKGGARQLVFVTGEAGIGKSTLVNTFLHERLSMEVDTRVMWGQCVDQYGWGEPYLPIVEAMRRAFQGSAPDDAERSLDARRAPGTGARMLRQMAEKLEALSAPGGMVLLVEDLHWADPSTLELLAYVAQRSDHARLLIIGTYRPLEAAASRLVDIEQTLLARRKCILLQVPRLEERAVREYLDKRFTHHKLPAALPAVLYGRTSGNPLFMAGVVDEWLNRGLLATSDGTCMLLASLGELARCVPDSFVRMIHRALERSSALERRVLEAASVAGNGFSTALVAAALSLDSAEVEELCLRWVHRGQFFRLGGRAEWRDGTVAERCEFLHALYQQVIYEQIGATRQAQLHLRTGERLEAAHGNQAGGIATELALHFERGRDYSRAVRYLRISGEHALHQGAYEAAIEHLTHALELVSKLPESEDRRAVELELRCLIAIPLRITRGFAASEVQQAYARAAQLCDERGSTRQLFLVMAGMGGVHILRAESTAALELGEKFLALAELERDSGALSEAHLVVGVAHHCLGQHRLAHAHLKRVTAASDPEGQAEHASLGGRHPVVAAQCVVALSSCLMGYLDTGRREVEEALNLARELDDPFAVAFGFDFAAEVCRLRGEHEAAQNHLDALANLSARYGFGYFSADAVLQEGGARIRGGEAALGIQMIQRGMAELEAAGARIYAKYWLGLLAEGYAAVGRAEQALDLIDDAIADECLSTERLWNAELLRTRAAILSNREDLHEEPGAGGEASERNSSVEDSLLRALEVARQQEAKLLELRAAVLLAKYWAERGQEAEAHSLLSSLYAWFREGLDTTELIEAGVLLQDLARRLTREAPRSGA